MSLLWSSRLSRTHSPYLPARGFQWQTLPSQNERGNFITCYSTILSITIFIVRSQTVRGLRGQNLTNHKHVGWGLTTEPISTDLWLHWCFHRPGDNSHCPSFCLPPQVLPGWLRRLFCAGSLFMLPRSRHCEYHFGAIWIRTPHLRN